MFQALFIITLLVLSALSWGFVNPFSPYPHIHILVAFVNALRPYATILYVACIASLFIYYLRILWSVSKKKTTPKNALTHICIAAVVLFLGFPGFSYDVFNYMATAKVAYVWHENPYIVMPIEIPNEPMLTYMHASNKVALYGPVWIGVSAIPQYLGFGNPMVTLFMFKLMEIAFYAGTLWLIWQLSEKNLWSLLFFALNPIVLTEIILSGHNDIVMMFFALASFYLLRKKKYTLSILALLFSIFIKYATMFIIPVYLAKLIRKDKMSWPAVWMWGSVFMYAAFLLSPIREEIYTWYFIWPLVFLAFIPGKSLFVWLSYGFTFGLPLRLAPFIYSQSWVGITPIIKKFVTFVPAAMSGLLYAYQKHVR
jgi:hypothetical protein